MWFDGWCDYVFVPFVLFLLCCVQLSDLKSTTRISSINKGVHLCLFMSGSHPGDMCLPSSYSCRTAAATYEEPKTHFKERPSEQFPCEGTICTEGIDGTTFDVHSHFSLNFVVPRSFYPTSSSATHRFTTLISLSPLSPSLFSFLFAYEVVVVAYLCAVFSQTAMFHSLVSWTTQAPPATSVPHPQKQTTDAVFEPPPVYYESQGERELNILRDRLACVAIETVGIPY